MKILKRAYVLCRIGFLSVFATTKMLENIEAEWAFVVGETDEIVHKPREAKDAEAKPGGARPGS